MRSQRFRHRLSQFATVPRRGVVLVVVLVVVVMLSLAAYSFSELMVSEVEATFMHAREVQARAFADSAIEQVAAVLAAGGELVDENLFHNPELFQAVLVHESELPRARGRFSVVAPVENDVTASSVRFGLMDESARLNPNALVELGLEEADARNALLALPEMTEDVADAILDWIDDDDTPREYGAESEYYETLASPYAAKNGPLESLEELLLVRGVTPWLLFGEDANRNGLFDASENDGEASSPWDNADGVLQPGWSAFLTPSSRESNLRADGSPRIDVNVNTLDELYDTLEAEFGEEEALFITAFRLNGPKAPPGEEESGSNQSGQSGGRPGGGGQQQGGGNQQQQGGGNQQAMQQFTQSLGRGLFGGGGGTVTRGGLDLSESPSHRIESLYELIDAEVEATVNNSRTVLKSPWTSDPGAMQEYLPDLLDTLSTTSEEFIPGRINVNQARLEVLLGVPEMTEELANAIVGSQMIDSSGMPRADTLASHATTGWLLMEGLVDLQQMRELDRFLTARGDVFRVQVVGHFDEGGPMVRLEAVVDATQRPPRVSFVRDLTELGWGYSQAILMGGLAQ